MQSIGDTTEAAPIVSVNSSIIEQQRVHSQRTSFLRLFCFEGTNDEVDVKTLSSHSPPPFSSRIQQSVAELQLVKHGVAFMSNPTSASQWFIDLVILPEAFGLPPTMSSPTDMTLSQSSSFLHALHRLLIASCPSLLSLTLNELRVHTRVTFSNKLKNVQSSLPEFIPMCEVTPDHTASSCYFSDEPHFSSSLPTVTWLLAQRSLASTPDLPDDTSVSQSSSTALQVPTIRVERASSAMSFREHNRILPISNFRFVNLHKLSSGTRGAVYWAWDTRRSRAVALKTFSIHPDFDLRYRLSYPRQCVSNPTLKKLRASLYPAGHDNNISNDNNNNSATTTDASGLKSASSDDVTHHVLVPSSPMLNPTTLTPQLPAAPSLHPGAFMPANMLCEIGSLQRLQSHQNIVRLLGVESGSQLCCSDTNASFPLMSEHLALSTSNTLALQVPEHQRALSDPISRPAINDRRSTSPDRINRKRTCPRDSDDAEIAGSIVVLDFIPFTLTTFQDQFPNRVLPLLQVRHIFRQIMSAVEHVHFHRMVLQNLKPNHVLVSEIGQVFLCDVGVTTPSSVLSEVLSAQSGRPQPCYLAPEVLLEESPQHASLHSCVDVWACACLLAEMVLGRPLFHAELQQQHSDNHDDKHDEKHEHGLGGDTHSSSPSVNRSFFQDSHQRIQELAARRGVLEQQELFFNEMNAFLPTLDEDSNADSSSQSAYRQEISSNEMAVTWQLLSERLGRTGFNLFIHMLQLDPLRRISVNLALQSQFLLDDTTPSASQ